MNAHEVIVKEIAMLVPIGHGEPISEDLTVDDICMEIAEHLEGQ